MSQHSPTLPKPPRGDDTGDGGGGPNRLQGFELASQLAGPIGRNGARDLSSMQAIMFDSGWRVRKPVGGTRSEGLQVMGQNMCCRKHLSTLRLPELTLLARKLLRGWQSPYLSGASGGARR